MKAEAWIFGSAAIFFIFVTPFYWFATSGGRWLDGRGDWTGTVALLMTALLTLMVTGYLGYHASRMDARPEDNKDAEVADGAGELGFFPPYSWWPLWCAMTAATMVYGIAIGAWWLFIIGTTLGVIALSGWVFEFYRGVHAH